MADDSDITNLLLGLQNLPNSVPGRTLNTLNDVAQGAGDIAGKAGDQLTDPRLILHPFDAPTLFGPAAIRALSGFVREQQRKGFGLPPEKAEGGEVSKTMADDLTAQQLEFLRREYGDYTDEELRAMAPQSNPISHLLHSAAGYVPRLPETEHPENRGASWGDWGEAAGSFGKHALNTIPGMISGGLNSSANWLEGRPEIGPDTLAPLGGISLAGLATGLPARAAHGIERLPKAAPPARLTPAIMVDGKIWAGGPTHVDSMGLWSNDLYARGMHDIPDIDAMMKAGRFVEGFTTPDGRFLNRQAAAKHVGAKRGGNALDDPEQGLETDWMRGNGLLADAPRASLPGIVLNGLEQRTKGPWDKDWDHRAWQDQHPSPFEELAKHQRIPSLTPQEVQDLFANTFKKSE